MMDGRRNFGVNPFTFRGVSSYAQAPLWCLALIGFPLALVISGLVLHWVNRAILPPIRQAVQQLPTHANLKGGVLTWPEAVAPSLSEGPFLSLAVNPSESRPLGQNADFQLDFRRDRFLFRTVIGEMSYTYDKRWTLDLARSEVEPWWGAWQPLLQGGVFFGMFIFLLLSWVGLATMGSFFVRTLGLMLCRRVTWGGSWKLSHAALFPGAMLMGLAIILYSTLQLSLTGLIILMPVHLVVGVIYLLGSTFALPSAPRKGSQLSNPFGHKPEPATPAKHHKKNPFQS